MIFQFGIGGYSGTSFSVELEGTFLVCRSFKGISGEPAFDPNIINISGNDHWQTMIDYLATRKWKGEYINPHILDGTSWGLKVVSGKINIESGGSNAYPPGFHKFVKMLNRVTEGNPTIY